jgi:hypothetical protein
MFAAIVPSTRAKTLVAGLIAVSMNPIGMLIARARGAWQFGATSNVWQARRSTDARTFTRSGVSAIFS